MPVQIIRQDITRVRCDAIVNPTNSALTPSGGTDAAIHRAAGPRLLSACRAVGHLETGETAVTPAFRLPCRHVIHTVGPLWEGGDRGEEQALMRCYQSVLQAAVTLRCRSVALPLISSGQYGFPKDRVLHIALLAIEAFLAEQELQVLLVVFDRTSYRLSEQLLCNVTAYIDDHYADTALYHARIARPDDPVRGRGMARSLSEEPLRPKRGDGTVGGARPATADLDSMLKDVKEKTFSRTLFRLIDEKGMGDVECYKKANVDRKTFSKIKCNENYKPSKQTVIAFAIALQLTLPQTQELLATVGMILSRSSKFDVIIEFFIQNGCYDMIAINETLFEFDQPLLGC